MEADNGKIGKNKLALTIFRMQDISGTSTATLLQFCIPVLISREEKKILKKKSRRKKVAPRGYFPVLWRSTGVERVEFRLGLCGFPLRGLNSGEQNEGKHERQGNMRLSCPPVTLTHLAERRRGSDIYRQ